MSFGLLKALYHCSDAELDRINEARLEALIAVAPRIIRIMAGL